MTGQPIEHCGHNHKQHEAGLASIDPLGNKSFLFRSSVVWPYKFALPPPSFSSPQHLLSSFHRQKPSFSRHRRRRRRRTSLAHNYTLQHLSGAFLWCVPDRDFRRRRAHHPFRICRSTRRPFNRAALPSRLGSGPFPGRTLSLTDLPSTTRSLRRARWPSTIPCRA